MYNEWKGIFSVVKQALSKSLDNWKRNEEEPSIWVWKLTWVASTGLDALFLVTGSGDSRSHFSASLKWPKLSDMVVTRWSLRDGHGQQQYSGRLWSLNDAQLTQKGPKETIPPYHYSTGSSGMNCWYKSNVFSSVFLSSFGELMRIVASVSRL